MDNQVEKVDSFTKILLATSAINNMANLINAVAVEVSWINAVNKDNPEIKEYSKIALANSVERKPRKCWHFKPIPIYAKITHD